MYFYNIDGLKRDSDVPQGSMRRNSCYANVLNLMMKRCENVAENLNPRIPYYALPMAVVAISLRIHFRPSSHCLSPVQLVGAARM